MGLLRFGPGQNREEERTPEIWLQQVGNERQAHLVRNGRSFFILLSLGSELLVDLLDRQ